LLLNWRFGKWLSCNAQAPKRAAQTPFSSAHTVKNLEGTLVVNIHTSCTHVVILLSAVRDNKKKIMAPQYPAGFCAINQYSDILR